MTSPKSAVTPKRMRNHWARIFGSAAMGIRSVVNAGSGFASLGRTGSSGGHGATPKPPSEVAHASLLPSGVSLETPRRGNRRAVGSEIRQGPHKCQVENPRRSVGFGALVHDHP